MGNTTSASEQISIVLDPPPSGEEYFVAGETLRGSLYAKSDCNFEPSPINIDFYFSGEEMSRVRYTTTAFIPDWTGGVQSITMNNHRNTVCTFLRIAIPLAENVRVSAGEKYRFPFEVQLPQDLPSTTFCEESETIYNGYPGHCEIVYRLKVDLKKSGRSLKRCAATVINIISAPLPPQPVPSLAPPKQQKVNVLCCFNVGTITIGTRIENTRIGKGEFVSIDFACRNQSRRGIKRVDVKIVEKVTWTDGGVEKNHAKRTLASASFHPREEWIKLSKDELKSLSSSAKQPNNTLQNNEQSLIREIYKGIFQGHNRAVLGVPQTSLQSYSGVIVKVEHYLKAKIITGGSCTKNPSTKIPLYIGMRSSFGGQGENAEYAIPLLDAMPIGEELLNTPDVPTPTKEPSAPPEQWVGAVTSAPMVMSQSAGVISGGKILQTTGEKATENEAEDDIFTPVAEVNPSLKQLLIEILLSGIPLSIVKKRLKQPEWKRVVFDVMSPQEYAYMIKAVRTEFYRLDIAAILAPSVMGGNFTHEYVIAAIQAADDCLKVPMVGKLLPLCVDLEENSSKILASLSEWEQLCTEQYFQDALNIIEMA